MEHYQTIVIGGGAAGLMSAITYARNKKSSQGLLVIEKNITLGRKITVTGNGRCNLTNLNTAPDKYYGQNTKCLYNIFNRFSYKDTIIFFEGLGVRLKTEDGDRIFPITNQAITVLDLLIEEITRLNISTKTGEQVVHLTPKGKGWEITTDKGIYQSKSVILSTGGKSYPQLGSSGDGFEFARHLGHRIIEPRPALVPMELVGNWYHKLQGVKTDAEITIVVQGKTMATKAGEVLFTHYGISGPVIIDLSRLIMDYLPKQSSAVLINFFPGYTTESLKQLLTMRWQAQPQKTFLNSLFGLLPKKLCIVLARELEIEETICVGQISKKELHRIADRLTHWTIEVKKTRPFSESMVTAGGVAMDEVNSRTE
ncbi:MAG: NAD(P)/FAD-dependent oxidoreductase [Candidatus Stahlbacteria bacterium]|nr:NAD(P)/FAD-dependent oxidoreductase [Candidatus Stahlbacteria bacterium]